MVISPFLSDSYMVLVAHIVTVFVRNHLSYYQVFNLAIETGAFFIIKQDTICIGNKYGFSCCRLM